MPVWKRIAAAVLVAAGLIKAQQLKDLEPPSRVKAGEVIVIGFLGGFERWDDENRSVRKLVMKLRTLPGVHAESISNHRQGTAVEFIEHALNKNHNRRVDPEEAATARIIIFGQGLGGNATVELARTLNEKHIPVLLTVQLDCAGGGNGVIPPNVKAAANYGTPIRAANPAATRILELNSDNLWSRVEDLIRAAIAGKNGS